MVSSISQPYRCSHVLSFDGEASHLHGQITAVGAVVFDVVTETEVDRFAARLDPDGEEYKRGKAQADPWCLENVYPILEEPARWKDRLSVRTEQQLLLAFYLWWAAWTRGLPKVLDAASREEVTFEQAHALQTAIERAHEESIRRGVTTDMDVLTVADWAHPVEHNLFSRVLGARREWGLCGPKPIHEIATLRLCDSLVNPDLGQGVVLAPNEGRPHDPLYDAIQSGLEAIALLKRLYRPRKK